MSSPVIVDKDQGIAIITFNRPDVYNALSAELVAALTGAIREVEKDEDVGVIILTGAGKAFSAGGDLDEIIELSSGQPEKREAYLTLFMEMILTIRGVPVPVIAAVNGYCIGGGNEINLACDLTIASEKAKFGQAGTKVGSVPLMGGTQLLPLLVGEKKSKEMIYLCRTYDARGWARELCGFP
jgi:enoyl-CoA hydratase/carnithine racemase